MMTHAPCARARAVIVDGTYSWHMMAVFEPPFQAARDLLSITLRQQLSVNSRTADAVQHQCPS